jgi:nucleoside 2-deoxyribosyltransferase
MNDKKPRRCFVIGPIGEPGSPERTHADMLLNNVIREALKDCDPPCEVARSDEIDDPGMITDRMIHDILNADLVIADLTFLNPNAFYELGIRHAREKPVIHFASSETKLPFDAMTHRAVIHNIRTWEGTKRAREQIRAQAKATEAEGYRVSNPITQANASFRMLESSDPLEQVIAELQIRLELLKANEQGERLEAGPRWGPPIPIGLSIDDTSLGELLSRLPRSATDVDRMLLGGHVAQARSADNAFSTGEAYALLTEQGVKVGNPSQLVKQNVIARRVLRHQRRYRVSQIGLDHLAQLLRPLG